VGSLALAALLALSLWQFQRKAWKEGLIEALASRAAAEPMSGAAFDRLACAPMQIVGVMRSCEYVAVRLTGSFDHKEERHVYTTLPAMPGGYGGPGYWVTTPLRLSDGRRYIVSRGFVPAPRKAPATRPEGAIPGEVQIVGLIRSAEARTMFLAANDPGSNVWFLRNPAELYPDLPGTSAGPDPRLIFIDLLTPIPPGALPRPTAGDIAVTNRHLEYALTWLGLAAVLLAILVALVADRFRQAQGRG
jgi:surfeit locus 1 family protein